MMILPPDGIYKWARMLLIAARLELQNVNPITENILMVRTWEAYPKTFGLDEFEEHHPDPRKMVDMLAKLYDKKYLRFDPDQPIIHLLPLGRKTAFLLGEEYLLQFEDKQDKAKKKKSRETWEQWLERTVATNMFHLLSTSQSSLVTYADCFEFLSLGREAPKTKEALSDAMKSVILKIREAEIRVMGEDGRILSTGRELDIPLCENLSKCFSYIRSNYASLMGRIPRVP